MKNKQAEKSRHKRKKNAIQRNNIQPKKAKSIKIPKVMPVNFFQTGCQEAPISALQFGICDDQNSRIAYTDITDSMKWVATVNNAQATPVTLTAIDKCVQILREDGNDERKCDAMLTYLDNIVFVELKDVRRNWISDAVEQLEITIQQFIANHDLSIYRHKRAFACNKKQPNFHVIDNEMKRRFFDTYRVRLNVQATIQI